MRKINHSYKINWISVDEFDYRLHENELIKYDAYLNMESKVINLSNVINSNTESRQAICYADGVENPACLTSIQFLIKDKSVNMICSFRSQHETLGRPSDEKMLNFLATKFIDNIDKNIDIDSINIICNVADYHNYKI